MYTETVDFISQAFGCTTHSAEIIIACILICLIIKIMK